MIVGVHTSLTGKSLSKVVYDIVVGRSTILFIDRTRPHGKCKNRWIYKPHIEKDRFVYKQHMEK